MRRYRSRRLPPRRAAVSWATRWERERDTQDEVISHRIAELEPSAERPLPGRPSRLNGSAAPSGGHMALSIGSVRGPNFD
jgi:hypothetical protein